MARILTGLGIFIFLFIAEPEVLNAQQLVGVTISPAGEVSGLPSEPSTFAAIFVSKTVEYSPITSQCGTGGITNNLAEFNGLNIYEEGGLGFVNGTVDCTGAGVYYIIGYGTSPGFAPLVMAQVQFDGTTAVGISGQGITSINITYPQHFQSISTSSVQILVDANNGVTELEQTVGLICSELYNPFRGTGTLPIGVASTTCQEVNWSGTQQVTFDYTEDVAGAQQPWSVSVWFAESDLTEIPGTRRTRSFDTGSIVIGWGGDNIDYTASSTVGRAMSTDRCGQYNFPVEQLCYAAIWLFVPTTNDGGAITNFWNQMQTKVPVAYFFFVQDMLSTSAITTNTEGITIDLTILGEEMPVIDETSYMKFFGDSYQLLYNLMKVGIYLMLIVALWNLRLRFV